MTTNIHGDRPRSPVCETHGQQSNLCARISSAIQTAITSIKNADERYGVTRFVYRVITSIICPVYPIVAKIWSDEQLTEKFREAIKDNNLNQLKLLSTVSDRIDTDALNSALKESLQSNRKTISVLQLMLSSINFEKDVLNQALARALDEKEWWVIEILLSNRRDFDKNLLNGVLYESFVKCTDISLLNLILSFDFDQDVLNNVFINCICDSPISESAKVFLDKKKVTLNRYIRSWIVACLSLNVVFELRVGPSFGRIYMDKLRFALSLGPITQGAKDEAINYADARIKMGIRFDGSDVGGRGEEILTLLNNAQVEDPNRYTNQLI